MLFVFRDGLDRGVLDSVRQGGRHHSHDHLLAPKQGVADELARAQRNGGVGVRHFESSLSG